MYTRRRMILILSILSMMIVGILALQFHLFPNKQYSNDDFGIATYISQMDKDEDGVDDQTDILENVRSYIATKPKYKSKYYEGGYPDDGYGTCVDVVGFGLKGAGYDLMQLVNEDIQNRRDQYDIETIDINIDFRRVKNLQVYFQGNAIPLTTDIYDIDAWQGGDIVVFKNHIGIVSDKRNRKGVTYVIHHSNPFQIQYEEDILETRADIIGHYRIS